MVTPPDPHACSYNRIVEEYCPSCVLVEEKNTCCDHPIIGLPKGHPNNHYSGCSDQNPLIQYKTWTPFTKNHLMNQLIDNQKLSNP